jgi:predicted restriction endonuclease
MAGMSHVCTETAPYHHEMHGYESVTHTQREFQAVRADATGARIGLYRCTVCGSRFLDALEPEHAAERDRRGDTL